MQLGSLREVIAEYVHDGQSLALEVFPHLNPFAAGREILGQGNTWRGTTSHVTATRAAHTGTYFHRKEQSTSVTISNQIST